MRTSKKLRWLKKKFRAGTLRNDKGKRITKGDDLSRMAIDRKDRRY